jgi:hypothetical protein
MHRNDARRTFSCLGEIHSNANAGSAPTSAGLAPRIHPILGSRASQFAVMHKTTCRGADFPARKAISSVCAIS